jgi:hypothetical protein
MQKKPLIHIWIFNHPFNGISDQVKFFISVLKQHGYAVSVGLKPRNSALNVVIENFSAESRDTLRAYCEATKKRVAIIMTEHLDFNDKEIFIHGDPLWSDNDYMHPATQLNRIKYLMECIPYIKCFFVLGDLPELRNMSSMLPGIPVRSMPFPRVDYIMNDDAESLKLINNDLLFTGALTEYRDNILLFLKNAGFSVFSPQKFVSCKRRNLITRSTKLTLNIPQRNGWRWLSLMRTIAALRYGRATVSIGTKDDSKIAVCTYQLDINDKDWQDILKEYVKKWPSLYKTAYENYMTMVSKYEQLKGFPHDIIEYWGITDGIGE